MTLDIERERLELEAKWHKEFDAWSELEKQRYWCDAISPREAWLAAKRSMQGSAEPVAVVGDVFTLHWIGSGPIAPLIERHGIKVGAKLYTAPPAPVSAEPVKASRDQMAARLIAECHAEIANLEAIKLPPHNPTIGIEELLSGYLPDDREDHWETIKAYADVHARSAVQLSAPRQECPGDTKITSAPASTDSKDSERYRWMRDTFVDDNEGWPDDVAGAKTGVELDIAVDAAIAAKEAGK